MPIFQRFQTWLGELRKWIAKGHIAWMTILTLVAALLFSFYTFPTETSVRATGYALQMIGVLFTFHGLLQVRAHFGHPSIMALTLKWFSEFPKWNRRITLETEPDSFTLTGRKLRVEQWCRDDPSGDVPARLDAIVNNLERLRAGQREAADQVDNLERSITDVERKASDAIKEASKTIRTDFEALHTDGILESLAGVGILAFGLTLSTLSPELSLLLH